MHTLRQLHSELAGKMIDNKSEARRITKAMIQVEAVMKLLQPTTCARLPSDGASPIRGSSAERCSGTPWTRCVLAVRP
jgi:hypothetical protein